MSQTLSTSEESETEGEEDQRAVWVRGVLGVEVTGRPRRGAMIGTRGGVQDQGTTSGGGQGPRIGQARGDRQDEAETAFNKLLSQSVDELEMVRGFAPSSPAADKAHEALEGAMGRMGSAVEQKNFIAALKALQEALAQMQIVSDERVSARETFWQACEPLTQRLETAKQKAGKLPGMETLIGEADKAASTVEQLSDGPDYRPAQQALPAMEQAVAALETGVAKGEYLAAREGLKKKENAATQALAGDVIGTALVKAQSDFNQALSSVTSHVSAEKWQDASDALKALETACDAAVKARTDYNDAKSAYQSGSAGLDQKASDAIGKFRKSSEFWKVAAKLETANNERKKAASGKDYHAAQAALQQVTALIGEINTLESQHAQKVQDAEKLVEEIDNLSVENLKGKTPKQKVEMLQKLMQADVKGDPPSDIRKAQHKIYQAMDMDPDFVDREKTFYEDVAKDLASNNDVKNARTGWGGKSQDDKLKVIRKIVEVQSKKLGFEPPEVVPIDKAPSGGLITNGYFSSNDGKIYINFNGASSVHNFAKAVDLAIHENAHNWQNRLVEDFNAGKIDESHPNYTQAMMFAINKQPGGYVKGEESFQVYKKQPMEDHSHMTGPHAASALIDELNKA